VVIAAVLLGEVLRPIQAVGALLTFVGVGLGSSQAQAGDEQGVGRARRTSACSGRGDPRR
jgi:drug/metabolite transporter (DMT)-like permease